MRGYVEREAEYHVKQWEETVEMRTPAFHRPITPLTRLLNQYNDICERILDEHDIEIGLWAYKKGFSGASPRPSGINTILGAGTPGWGHQKLAMTARYLNVQMSPFEL